MENRSGPISCSRRRVKGSHAALKNMSAQSESLESLPDIADASVKKRRACLPSIAVHGRVGILRVGS